MRAYKFLELEGVGVFSRFAWPLPDGGPGAWVESEVDPCRAGVHACRPADLPYWVAPALYEIELDAPVTEHALKLVAARGRLLRRIEAWNIESRAAYGEMCLARARARRVRAGIARRLGAAARNRGGRVRAGRLHRRADRGGTRRARRPRRRARAAKQLARRAPRAGLTPAHPAEAGLRPR